MFEVQRQRSWRMVSSAVVGCLLIFAPSIVRGEPTKTAESLFRQLDTSGDGVLTMDDATVGTRSLLERVFKEADKGPGDRVTHDEFISTHERLRNKSAPGAAKTPPASSSSARLFAGRRPDASSRDRVHRRQFRWCHFACRVVEVAQNFSRLDGDKDNSLSSTELEPAGGAAELLMQLADLNGDGKITRVEWGKLVQSFTRLDANSDKSLDEAELQKVAEATVASASGSASLSGGGKSGEIRSHAVARHHRR